MNCCDHMEHEKQGDGPSSSPSRRHILGGAAMLAASALPISRGLGQVPGAGPKAGGKIDIHHHILPPNILPHPGAPAVQGPHSPYPAWSPQIAIDEMDRNDVATGISSTGTIPNLLNMETEARRSAIRKWNEYGTRLGSDHPGRFGLFAPLPLPDVEGSLKEIEYALGTLKADGVGILTSYGDLWLGDPKLRPVFEELNRRKALVFVHTTDASCCTQMSYMTPPANTSWIEWPMNTARCIYSLMANGVFRDLPDVRFIFAHGGGVMPLLIARLRGMRKTTTLDPADYDRVFPNGVDAEFKKLRFEIAQAFDQVNYDALSALVPTSNILYGSDFPWFDVSASRDGFAALGISPETRHAISRGNAELLMPRWKA
ncbi:MAG: amidohydrolase family protein [Rhizomicrobium sp.]